MNFEATQRAPVDDRPIYALLAAYAARTLPAPLDALVQSHLDMKAENRGYVAALEASFGLFLSEIAPIPLTGRDRRLVNIFAQRDGLHDGCPASLARPGATGGPLLPAALRRYVGCELHELPWRTMRSGIEQAIVAEGTFGLASFVRCQAGAGKHLRVHGHSGLEAILVLQGAFTDQQGRYRPGDIAVADESCVHRPVVDGDSDLICYMVSEDKVPVRGPICRMIEQIFGR